MPGRVSRPQPPTRAGGSIFTAGGLPVTGTKKAAYAVPAIGYVSVVEFGNPIRALSDHLT
jgi:hypothetical protein